MSEKGMEMAIQVFIILFVLLAVAMLVLQMVSQQVVKVGGELEKKTVDEWKQECQSLCIKAKDISGKVNFCKHVFTQGVDLTKNQLKNDYDESLLAGIGICENRIPCPVLIDCEVDGALLKMNACKSLMCNYWQMQGLSTEQSSANLKKFIQPGECYSDPKNQPNHWFTMVFDKNRDGKASDDEVVC
ncbi:MAG: hypothetical protein N3F05_02365 [Candidatus Diapherotrites archaeon]|nr:hypothetical protein [Candidatus Diapherotrites archaeon]